MKTEPRDYTDFDSGDDLTFLVCVPENEIDRAVISGFIEREISDYVLGNKPLEVIVGSDGVCHAKDHFEQFQFVLRYNPDLQAARFVSQEDPAMTVVVVDNSNTSYGSPHDILEDEYFADDEDEEYDDESEDDDGMDDNDEYKVHQMALPSYFNHGFLAPGEYWMKVKLPFEIPAANYTTERRTLEKLITVPSNIYEGFRLSGIGMDKTVFVDLFDWNAAGHHYETTLRLEYSNDLYNQLLSQGWNPVN